MKVNCNIDDVIDFLKSKRDEGYTSVELITDARAHGWHSIKPTIEFIFNEDEPNVLGIDARK